MDKNQRQQRRAYSAQTTERYESLASMRDANNKLLEIVDDDSISDSHSEMIREFLNKAVATGTIIDKARDRRQAQGMIDYWAGTLYSSTRWTGGRSTTEDSSKSLTAETVLADFDNSFVSKIAADGSALIKRMTSEEQQIARRLLLRLTNLEATSRSFNAKTVDRSSLGAADDATLNQVLSKLADARVITIESGDNSKKKTVRLAHESLVRNWPELREWLEHRLRFYEAAVFWRDSNRHPSALLTDDELLNELTNYRDLGDLEEDFADACREKRSKIKNRVTYGLAALLAVFALITAFAGWKWTEAAIANRDLKEERNKLQQAVGDLREKERKLILALAARDRSETQAKSYRDEVDWQRSELIKRSGEDPNVSIKDLLDELDISKIKSVNATSNDEQFRVTPGSRVGPQDNAFWGSAGLFVEDSNGNVFMTIPDFLADSKSGNVVAFGEDDEPVKLVTTVQSSLSIEGIKLVPIADPQMVSNKVEGQLIGELANNMNVGDTVTVLGAGSAKVREGKILELEDFSKFAAKQQIQKNAMETDGQIITDRISSAGDAGAPVLNERGEVVGILVGGFDEQSFVTPIADLIRESGYQLLQR